MASKAKPSGKSDVKWVSVELTKQQAEDMKKLMPNADTILDGLLKLIESGYKASFSYDSYNSCHAVYVIPANEENGNSGYILSARSGSPMGALRGALYRHFVLFDEQWGDRDRQVIDEE